MFKQNEYQLSQKIRTYQFLPPLPRQVLLTLAISLASTFLVQLFEFPSTVKFLSSRHEVRPSTSVFPSLRTFCPRYDSFPTTHVRRSLSPIVSFAVCYFQLSPNEPYLICFKCLNTRVYSYTLHSTTSRV